MGVLLDQYLTEHGPTIVGLATQEYNAMHLARILGGYTVAELTPAVQREYISTRRQEGVRDGTIARELSTLSAALRHAVREQRMKYAPVIKLPKPGPPRQRWLTPLEARALLRECGAPHLRLFVLLALYTAARRGAILALTWFQVDLMHATIDLNAPDAPETNKRRPRVPIDRVLLAHLKAASKRKTSGSVVEYAGEGMASVRRSFRAACARAGLKGVTPHTLRHTAITWMMQRGLDPWKVSGYTNVSLKTLLRVYGHHHPEYLHGPSQAITQAIGAELARNGRKTGGRRDPKRGVNRRKIKVVSSRPLR